MSDCVATRATKGPAFRNVVNTYDAADLCVKMARALSTGSVFRLEGRRIPIESVRLRLFMRSDRKCVVCGRQGTYFALEHLDANHRDRTPDLNLYGTREDGSALLFTRDHILPKSLSGSEDIDNMQVMCTDCNGAKGHAIRKEDLREIHWQIKTGRASLWAILKAWLAWKTKTREPLFAKLARARKAKRRLTAARAYYADVYRAFERELGVPSSLRRAFAEGQFPENRALRRRASRKVVYHKDGTVVTFLNRKNVVEVMVDGKRRVEGLEARLNAKIAKLQTKHQGKGYWKKKYPKDDE